jgi:hypothetical protein
MNCRALSLTIFPLSLLPVIMPTENTGQETRTHFLSNSSRAYGDSNEGKGKFNTALHEWEASRLFNFVEENGDTSESNRLSCPKEWGKMRVCKNYNHGYTGWAGRVSYFYYQTNGHAVQASVRLNDFYGISDTACRRVMCHEIGPLFGLATPPPMAPHKEYAWTMPVMTKQACLQALMFTVFYKEFMIMRILEGFGTHTLDSWKHKYLIPRTT